MKNGLAALYLISHGIRLFEFVCHGRSPPLADFLTSLTILLPLHSIPLVSLFYFLSLVPFVLQHFRTSSQMMSPAFAISYL